MPAGERLSTRSSNAATSANEPAICGGSPRCTPSMAVRSETAIWSSMMAVSRSMMAWAVKPRPMARHMALRQSSCALISSPHRRRCAAAPSHRQESSSGGFLA
jgi:hypothetical protein